MDSKEIPNYTIHNPNVIRPSASAAKVPQMSTSQSDDRLLVEFTSNDYKMLKIKKKNIQFIKNAI